MHEGQTRTGGGGAVNGSRREFLIAAGATAGGLSAYPGAVAGEPTDRVTIAEGVSAISRATAAFEREHPDVGIETIETDGFGAFLGGEADVQHAARPMTVDEREHAATNGIEFEERELPLGGVAALGPSDGWCRCLSEEERSTFADGSVEVWSEVDSEVPGDRAPVALPEKGTNVLVRGTRSHQYAIGHGGTGYHKADPSELETLDESKKATPVVRLGFVYVDRDALDREAVTELLDRQGRRERRRTPSDRGLIVVPRIACSGIIATLLLLN